jgi:hypothetical protein
MSKLSDYMIIEINNKIDEEYTKIHNLKKQINLLTDNINNMKSYLKQNCQHNFVIDHYIKSEHTEYICSKCQTSK